MNQTPASGRTRIRGSRVVTYVFAVLMALWILLPIMLIASAAFTERASLSRFPRSFLPAPFATDTMTFFLNATGVLPAAGRSILVAIIAMVLSLTIGAPAGYALARFRFRGRDLFRLVIVSTRAFPIVILSIPLAVTFINWGINDSPFGLALMHTALAMPFTVLVTSSVFAGVPRDLEEAAETLGCHPVQAFVKVALPLALPGLAAATLFTFVLSWNEVFASVILTLRNRTLPALLLATLDQAPDYFKFAGGFFLLVPSLIFMLFIRKYLFNLWGRVTK